MIIASIGSRGTGVTCRKWDDDVSVLLQKPVITVPAHRGIAIPRFIDSRVADVNECISSVSPTLQADSLPAESSWKFPWEAHHRPRSLIKLIDKNLADPSF